MNLFHCNDYFIYDDGFKHDFYLSKLELRKKSLNSKPLKKVYNESEFYFLVNQPTNTNLLHYFTPGEGMLRVYNLESEKWKSFSAVEPIPVYSATVYDPKRERFYLVGGEISNRKYSKILWYHRQEGWGSAPLKIARSSAMVTLIESGK